MSDFWVPARGSTREFLSPDIRRYFQNISMDENNGWLRYEYDENATGFDTLLRWEKEAARISVSCSDEIDVDDDEGMSKEDLDESQKLLYEFLGVSESDCEK